MKNNETFGMSCEKAICELFKDTNGINKIDEKRVDREIINKIKPFLISLFEKHKISKLIYTGCYEDKVDFIDTNNKTYSLKTNQKKSTKIAPQIIGQPSKLKFNQLIYSKLKADNEPDKLEKNEDIKKWIIENIKKLLILYFENLLCCDYLIYIKEQKNNYNVFCSNLSITKNDFEKIIKDKVIFFSKNKDNWNESNTVKINMESLNKKNKNLSIGEFQFHKNRDCIKFRFNINSLLEIIEYYKYNEKLDEISILLKNTNIDKK